MAAQRIAVIGLGLLGSALAERLTTSGFEVAGFDSDPRKRTPGSAESAHDAVRGCDRIVLSLPDSDAVDNVLDGVLPALRDGAIIIDTTTGDPERVDAAALRLERAGVDYLDATIGGSSRQVREGTAIVICGAKESAFAEARPILERFGAPVFHVGPPGAGTRMKLAVNLALGLNRAVLAEALAFGAGQGLDPAKVLEVLKAGPAYSRAMDAKGQKMIAGDFEPEARLSQHLKDVRLILAASLRNGSRAPLSELHRSILEHLEADGWGDKDNSAVIRAWLDG
ncbi:MAG: NAD(P)-dependent oxidoreductase [Bryobacteraceae bacterium]